MHVGKSVIASILTAGNVSPYLDAGFDGAWLASEASAAIFEGQTARAYAYLLRHADKHGRVPPIELFQREFPEVSFRLPADPALPSELIELTHTVSSRSLIELAQMRVQDILTRDDAIQGDRQNVEDAAAVLAQAHEQLQAVSTSTRAQQYPTATLDDLLSAPNPEALIEGALDAGTVHMLSGPSGKGKSFVALDWALCVASGNNWLGRASRQGSVVYVAAEGARSLGYRGGAWQQAFGKVPQDNITFVTKPVQLDDAGTGYLTAKIRETGADLLVIDTLARCTVGMEENSARDMGLIVHLLYRLRDAIEECGTTILIVHHTGYDTRRARGSSALAAGMDSVTDIIGDDPHLGVTLDSSKRKDGEEYRDVTVKLRETFGSCVLEECGAPLAGEKSLDGMLTDGGGLTVAAIADATGKHRTTVTRRLAKMEKEGKVTREQQKKGGDVWQKNGE